MIKRKDYIIDTNKIKTIQDVKNIFDCLGIICDMSILDKSDPRYELAKEYFVIPHEETPRKSLEEIEQELNEKFDDLLVKIKRKFDVSQQSAEYRFKQFCDKQDSDFEEAKRTGSFPQYLSITTSGNVSIGNNIVPNSYVTMNNNTWSTEFRLNTNGKGVGFWSIQPNIKVYLNKKPNFIVRYFSKLLLDFEWKSK